MKIEKFKTAGCEQYRIPNCDRYDHYTSVYYPGTMCLDITRKKDGWHWSISHLSRDEKELSVGSARTLAEAREEAMDELVSLSEPMADRAESLRAWLSGNVRIGR